MSRLIDADFVKEKLLNALRKITDDMADAVEYGDDEIYFACKNQQSAYATSITLLDHAPTIEAVPVVHGEWENVGDNEEDLCFRCTNCNTEFSCEINMRQFAKHCPNCGADMRKGGAE